MNTFKTLAGAAVAGVALVSAGMAVAEYPDRAITIVVPYAPGGGGDTFTRALADQASDILGVTVNVENRTGGGATIGVGSVARAKADGYTLGFVSASPILIAPNFSNVPYDPATDFTYLQRFVTSPHPVMVMAGSQWQDWDGLVAWARENPGRLRWSTAGVRGAPHIATQAAFDKEGVETVFVPMQGSSEVLAGLLGDTLDVGVISDFAVPLAAGDIRVLAEIGPEPIPQLPGVPTYKDKGYPLTPTIFFGLAGPAGLPDEVIAAWDSAMKEIVESEQFGQVAERLNANLAYQPHAEFQAAMLRDIEGLRTVLKDMNLTE
jgi:tripartite-type tricarboxylate transporter receptor subunit TctC